MAQVAQGRLIETYSGTSTEAFPGFVNEGKQTLIDQGPPIPVAELISIDDLYPAAELELGLLPAALAFLREACDTTFAALQSYVDRNFLQADEYMQRVHAHLYEAFCQRELGDGYAGVINACMTAFENSRGQPFSANQINAMHQVLMKLRNEPLLKYADALTLIDSLEAVELNTEPPAFDALTELLSSESVR